MNFKQFQVVQKLISFMLNYFALHNHYSLVLFQIQICRSAKNDTNLQNRHYVFESPKITQHTKLSKQCNQNLATH